MKKFKVSGRAACAVIGQPDSCSSFSRFTLVGRLYTSIITTHFYLSWIFDATIIASNCVFLILETTLYCIRFFQDMSEELLDEITSINSIYGENTLIATSDDSTTYALTLPIKSNISLRTEFPADYPDAPPSILGTQHIGDNVAKGEGQQIVDCIREVLAEVYIIGSPCIFDLIEEGGQKLQQLGLDASSREEEQQAAQTNGQDPGSNNGSQEAYSDEQHQSLDDLGDAPPWVLSDVITEKKSVFLARAAEVHSVDEAKSYLAHLLGTDKKAAKATHNITAWRIQGENGVQFQDCDDDGESAAGGRLLHLLELMGVWNAMVVVTRWYGGIHLGPDRFRLINQAARDAMMKGYFTSETAKEGKEGNKKKGKK